MLKKILIGVGVLVGLIILAIVAGAYFLMPDKARVVDFIKDNPERTAILLIRNDSVLAARNTDQVMPLASTVKIIIAIEYATQSARGIINPDEPIPLAELELLHVPGTDGGAHKAWLEAVQPKVTDARVSIREIAKGMIRYSSNANAEWLLNKLGIEQVNQRLDSLGIQQHTPIYNIVSALFVGKQLFPEKKGTELIQQLKALDTAQYIQATLAIHQLLLQDTAYKHQLGEQSLDVQRIWSDRLPASTVKEYVGLMQKMNDRNFFDTLTQQYLDEVMEYLLENPTNREWLEHSGMKGGSTAFLLTKALYATDKTGAQTEMVYFLQDLSIPEMMRLQMSLNEFELNILNNPVFRSKLQQELK